MRTLVRWLHAFLWRYRVDWRFPAVALFFALACAWAVPLERIVWGRAEPWDDVLFWSSFSMDVLIGLLLLTDAHIGQP